MHLSCNTLLKMQNKCQRYSVSEVLSICLICTVLRYGLESFTPPMDVPLGICLSRLLLRNNAPSLVMGNLQVSLQIHHISEEALKFIL